MPRIRIAHVSPNDVLRTLTGGGPNPVPPDALVTDVGYDPQKNAFIMYVVHPSFADVEAGDVPPLVPGAPDAFPPASPPRGNLRVTRSPAGAPAYEWDEPPTGTEENR